MPDHYRFPIPGMGMERVRYSALDVAEVEMGRDRTGPYSDRRACLPEDADRLGRRERLAVAHMQRVAAARRMLDKDYGERRV